LFRKHNKTKKNEKNQNKKQKKKLTKMFTKEWNKNNQVKYLFRAWTFTWKVYGCPSKLSRQKELRHKFLEITNGPSHRF
jgi:hypothetical protein